MSKHVAYFLFLVVTSVFFHILDDYVLQGILAKLKQRAYWENAVDGYRKSIYCYDHVCALIMHAMSWSFMVMIPAIVYTRLLVPWAYLIAWCVNVPIHAITDNAKCNRYTISLVVDQLIHLAQVVLTVVFIVAVYLNR